MRLPSQRDRAHVLVFGLGAAFFELRHQHRDGLDQIHRLESAHHDGDPVLLAERLVFPIAHHRAHVARRNESLHAIGGRFEQQADGGRHQNVETSMEKFRRPSRLACKTAMALAGAVVSKPIPKNTTRRSGLARAILTASMGE